jgi:rsbT co-antagonist protein RsbR
MQIKNTTVDFIQDNSKRILDSWISSLKRGESYGKADIVAEEETLEEAEDFLKEFINVLSPGKLDPDEPAYNKLRQMVVNITRNRAAMGYSAKETAFFIYSLKSTLMNELKEPYKQNPSQVLDEMAVVNELIDEIGAITFDTFINDREDIIRRQRQELLEASTPILKLWEGVLGVPIIGTVDSERSQKIMDNLLTSVMETNYEITIIDISGVNTLDTLTAQHILRTAAAVRLMGAQCIISGISPVIAQTIISLDIDLGSTITKGTMSEALQEALRMIESRKKFKNLYGQNTDSQDGRSAADHHSDRAVR